MNRSQSNNKLIDPQWLKVLKYYIGLSPEQKQNYADRLLPQQKQYLMGLHELYLKNNSLLDPVYPADSDKHLLHKQGYRFKHSLDKLRHAASVAAIVGIIMVSGTTLWMQRETIGGLFSQTQTQAFYDDWAEENFASTEYKETFQDPDQDGLLNEWEFVLGTDPKDSDTNKNGVLDGVEVLETTYDEEPPDEITY